MPLRDDLLTPIDGDNPSGADLRYDKVFMQIEEARAEDDETIPSGAWGRAAKKADRVLVIKLAGDLLAKRTKDLRVAGWYLESLIRREGFGQLAGGVGLLLNLQTEFWDTVHPAMEDDSTLDLRVSAVEKSALLIAAGLKTLPLTRNGIHWVQWQDATAVGVEETATTPDRVKARQEAIERGALTGEDLQKAIDETPKAFYIERDNDLANSLELLQTLDEFQQEKYGDDYPSLSRLKSTVEALQNIVASTLTEKRKTDPDPIPEAEAETEPDSAPFEAETPYEEPAVEAPAAINLPAASVQASPRRASASAAPDTPEGAHGAVLAAATYFQAQDADSPVPYLLCSALRMGETRAANLSDMSFAVAPPTETRQAVRRLAGEGSWEELITLALRALGEPCGRVWLDLHRYIWRAAQESSKHALATVVISQIRALLTDLPELRTLVMDDDTPAGNAETQQWITEWVLPPAPEPVVIAAEPEPVSIPVYVAPATSLAETPLPDIFETAREVMSRGRTSEAISMLLRDSEQQPSGRMRFLRRVQVAQLCVGASQFTVAYPLLRDISAEIERRTLETWETADTLSTPLGLYLRCLDQRNASEAEREAIFDRLCRLDPQAALMVGS